MVYFTDMYLYDLTIVLDGKTTPAKRKSAVEKIIASVEGNVGEVKDHGERDLAYPIAKSTTGIYFTLPVNMEGESTQKLNDKLRHEEGILRYLLIRTGESVVVTRPKAEKKSNGKKS